MKPMCVLAIQPDRENWKLHLAGDALPIAGFYLAQEILTSECGMGAKTIDIVLSACGYGNHGHEYVTEKGEVIAKNKPFPGRAVGGI